MKVRCCGNCKKGHFGNCLNGKCVADRYSEFVPANPQVEEALKMEIKHKEECLYHFIRAVEWFQNGC